MQYIAIGYRNVDKVNLRALEIKSISYDLKLVIGNYDLIESEVEGGVVSFGKRFDLQLIQLIRSSTEKNDDTSGGVDENLFDYSMGKAQPNLLNFLEACKDLLPCKYYLMFAFDWDTNQTVRYKKFTLEELSEYLYKNGSWYLRLYDFVKDFYTSELDFPLVVEINNG